MASRRQRSTGADPFGGGEDLSLHEVDSVLYGGIQAADRQRVIVRPIRLEEITVEPDIQVRVEGLDEETVESYLQVLLNGGEFDDPIVLFRDDETERLILADGFHRCEATFRALQSGATVAPLRAKILPGGREAALEYAEEANLRHGLKLSMKDKFHILERRIKRGHPWNDGADNAIAQELGVSNSTVKRWRQKVATLTNVKVPTVRRAADGRTMSTGRIGQATKSRPAKPRLTPPPPSALLDYVPTERGGNRQVRPSYAPDPDADLGYEEPVISYDEDLEPEEPPITGALARPGGRERLEAEVERLAQARGLPVPQHPNPDREAAVKAAVPVQQAMVGLQGSIQRLLAISDLSALYLLDAERLAHLDEQLEQLAALVQQLPEHLERLRGDLAALWEGEDR